MGTDNPSTDRCLSMSLVPDTIVKKSEELNVKFLSKGQIEFQSVDFSEISLGDVTPEETAGA